MGGLECACQEVIFQICTLPASKSFFGVQKKGLLELNEVSLQVLGWDLIKAEILVTLYMSF